jgi:hypothetical protein
VDLLLAEIGATGGRRGPVERRIPVELRLRSTHGAAPTGER